MFVKICGITNESDALFAASMGADAIGFVFAPSPRQVSATHVRDIIRRLPPEVMTFGVFRDEANQRIVDLVNTAGLRGVQMHGHETPEDVQWVRRRIPNVIKAFSILDPMLQRVEEFQADAVIVDSSDPGSGQTFDWNQLQQIPQIPRLILAGGLQPENVFDAVSYVQPWGVDVSTGVESSPGKKDALALRYFINNARAGSNQSEISEDQGTW